MTTVPRPVTSQLGRNKALIWSQNCWYRSGKAKDVSYIVVAHKYGPLGDHQTEAWTFLDRKAALAKLQAVKKAPEKWEFIEALDRDRITLLGEPWCEACWER